MGVLSIKISFTLLMINFLGSIIIMIELLLLIMYNLYKYWSYSSVGEHLLDVQGVEGSSPPNSTI